MYSAECGRNSGPSYPVTSFAVGRLCNCEMPRIILYFNYLQGTPIKRIFIGNILLIQSNMFLELYMYNSRKSTRFRRNSKSPLKQWVLKPFEQVIVLRSL